MIAVVTCMHGRAEVSRIFCEGIIRLRKETGLDIQVFAAISDAESLKVCNDYGANTIFATNNPLGAKWNAAFNFAMQSKPEAVLIMGDDDLISSEYLLKVRNTQMQCSGLDRIAFLNCKTKDAMDFKYQERKTIGAGRYIPFGVLEKLKLCTVLKRDGSKIKCNTFKMDILNRDGVGFSIPENDIYQPYDKRLNSSLDFSLELSLAKQREEIVVFKSDKIHCVDLKTKKNIWGFERFEQISDPCTFEDATWFTGDVEREMINKLK